MSLPSSGALLESCAPTMYQIYSTEREHQNLHCAGSARSEPATDEGHRDDLHGGHGRRMPEALGQGG